MNLKSTQISDNRIFNNDQLKNYSGKKTLVFGLGVLGGGIASTNWLLDHDAIVKVTDLKTIEELSASISSLNRKVELRLGKHVDTDILDNDVIVFNPDIPILSRYVNLAKDNNKLVENEATIFYKLCNIPIAAVTGTRGKTTTAAWITHFLDAKYSTIQAGNSPSNPLLKTLQLIENKAHDLKIAKKHKPLYVINELPSYHLEYFRLISKSPDIAVITNISPDHLNRHPSLEDYVNTKANIFFNQNSSQHLILNYNNRWTEYLLEKPHKGKTWLFSKSIFPYNFHGIYYKDGLIYFRDKELNIDKKVLNIGNFKSKYGEHNLENLLASSLAAFLSGINWDKIQSQIQSLPQIPHRQEVIYSNKNITIINDNAATSPEGSIQAIKRFSSKSCLLITGGTDKLLDYSDWAKIVKQCLPIENVFFLEGSATVKMLSSLKENNNGFNVYKSLLECVKAAIEKAFGFEKATIIFSPAAKSFEKFRNEFDRGKAFDEIIAKEVENGFSS